MAVIVIDKPEFIVRELTGKSEPVLLGRVSFCSEKGAKGSIFIASPPHLLSVEDGSDVLQGIVHEVKMLVVVWGVVFPACHHQEARGSRFRRIPQAALYKHRFRLHQIQLGHLQIAPVEEPGVAGYCSIDGDLLFKAPPPVVVAAGDGRPSILAGEDDGAVVGVVGHFPDTCGSLDSGLVAIGIEVRNKRFTPPSHLGVLVEPVGLVGHFFLQFAGGFAVADVVVGANKASSLADAVFHQLAAAII